MANVNMVVGVTIQQVDITPNTTPVNYTISGISLPCTTTFSDLWFQAGTTPTVVALPAATVWSVYVRNRHASNTLTVTFTPTGGSAQTCVLVPGGVFLYHQPSEGAGGITALSLTGSGANTGAELYIGS